MNYNRYDYSDVFMNYRKPVVRFFVKRRTLAHRWPAPTLGVILALTPVSAAPPRRAAEFIKLAGASDLYEKTASAIILPDARDPGMKAFARMMIDDHSRSTAAVVAAAKSDGILVAPPALSAL